MPSPCHRSDRKATKTAQSLRRRLSSRAAALALALSVTLQPITASARDTAPSPDAATPPAILESLNDGFRKQYHARTQEVLESLPLVLVVQNHTITAVRGTQRRLYPVPLQRYSEARAILHAMLAFNGLMGRLAHAAPESAEWAHINTYRRDIQLARQQIPHTSLSRQEKSMAQQILQQLDKAAEHAAATRKVTSGWIADSLRPTEPVLAAMVDSIGKAHAQTMTAVLKQVQADATPAEWANAVAVVTGPMTARRNNLETAIVASVLGSEHLGTRIFYSENIFTVDGALAYLQTVAGDRELSVNVFGRPHRMWEDLLTPVSRTLVEKDFYTELPR